MNFHPRLKLRTVSAVVLLAAIPILLSPSAARSADDVALVVDVVVVAKGYRTSALTGRAMMNEKNEKIGTIDDFIIGRDKVLFVVLQIGGFLGIGSHLVAVPYQSIEIEGAPGGKPLLRGASKDELKRLPEFKYGKSDQSEKKDQK